MNHTPQYIYFDIEGNGLLDEITEVHCLVTIDSQGWVNRYRGESLETGVNQLATYAAQGYKLVAHNGIKYDIPALDKVFGLEIPKESIEDTLVLSRLIYPDIWQQIDEKLIEKGLLNSKYSMQHSLESWGARLKCPKTDYQGGWEEWSQEMEDYCEQDVWVLKKLHEHLLSKKPSAESVRLEHEIQWIIHEQELNGFGFDVVSAEKLYGKLLSRQYEIHEELRKIFRPWFTKGELVTPKVNNSATWITKGVPYTKVKFVEFNPSSRQHIAKRLQEDYNWKPKDFTNSGQPELNEKTLESLKVPFKDLLIEYLLVSKRLGQLADGSKGWLKMTKGNRIHGSMITNGAVTGRATHSNPNLGQVPSCSAPYGEDCRALFQPYTKGWLQVGMDLSGLELRCLAHYMALWDSGDYGRILLEGDIHTVNQEAAGLPTRSNAKTFIYGFLYGAGDAKIGQIVGKGSKEGKILREKFLQGLPALDKLVTEVKRKAAKGFLKGLDGRIIPVRHAHAALNTLLQSCGAIIAKQWIVEVHKAILEGDIRCHQMAWVHDELQFECHPGDVERLMEAGVKAAVTAGEYFKMRIRIDAESKHGFNWKETH